MLTLIDRQLIRGYFKGYFICLVSLLSLYVVVDLFTNLEEFSHHSGGIGTTARLIWLYYGYKVWQIFDRLCEAILVLAATFTIAWMRRNNEQVPLLSSGISTQRIVRPVLLSACVMMTLNIVNQEFIIPTIGMRLMYQRDDPEGEKEIQVRGAYDPNGVHIEGDRATRREMVIRNLRCTIPAEVLGRTVHITSSEARYVPGTGPRRGGWELTGADPPELDVGDNAVLEQIDKGKFFLKASKVDFESLTRHQNAYLLSSTWQIYRELESNEGSRQGTLQLDRKKAVLFHSRLTRPLLSVLLVVLGLSVILGDQNRNVYISVGMCLGLCALLLIAVLVCRYLGDKNYVPPALSAWLPLLLFAPYAIVKFDAVHT